MLIEVRPDVADEVEKYAEQWNTEPDDVVDRMLRAFLLDGKNGIGRGDLMGESEE